jgi:nucleotide-binding universal stress UspA family protein
MLEKLLLAVDRSEHSRKAIPAAVELARAGGGAVHVLYARELRYPSHRPCGTSASKRPSSWSTGSSPTS